MSIDYHMQGLDECADGWGEEPEQEADPIVEAMSKTPEGMGLVHWTWTADALQSFISDVVSDLKYPMTPNLLAEKLAELGEWFEELRRLEAVA